MYNGCPYCQSHNLSEVISDRNRPENHKLVSCDCCSRFSIKVANGLSFPLSDPYDKESDPCTNIIRK